MQLKKRDEEKIEGQTFSKACVFEFPSHSEQTQRRSSTAAATATTKVKSHPEAQVTDGTRKCVSGAPVLEDRSDPTKFEPLSVELRQPDSAILLLDCPEKPILLQAAAALASFASKTPRNLHTLFDLNIVDSVCPLVRHPDVYTRRFALKLLALMSAVRNVQAHLLRDDSFIALFIELLAGEADLFLQEFSSRLLAELTSDPAGCAMLVERLQVGYGASLLLGKLRSEDPDVKRNATEIVANLLGDPLGFKLLTKSEVSR
ncbi:hypothetical protein QAD02_022869 [Eretmocerus hayati]|uniref:Uncharacterized protein n=1 Tax=Eretmocerus hayati TaxID=131215 RepID=A0ACC2PZ45_9HYME|nr:hypothetical protein QAD02_022869 [Eretmocerus hayati]